MPTRKPNTALARSIVAGRADQDATIGKTAVRTKPVRITLDLTPALYRELTAWTLQAATELDRPKVSQVDAMRATIAALSDPQVSAAVIEHLAQLLD